MPKFQFTLDHTFQALADPTRRAVIERLSRGPATVSDLAQPFAMALPSFMQHLGFLEARGLIRTHKTGRVRTCRIVAEPFEEMASWLADQRAHWIIRLAQFDAYITTLDERG